MLNPESKLFLPQVETYKADGRKSIRELYLKYSELVDSGWSYELITKQTININNKIIIFPVYAFTSPYSGIKPIDSLWILGGVHGEEPAGPNAFAEEIDFIKDLPDKRIPVVFIPLLNPCGYFRNWRYFNEKTHFEKGISVSDSEHLLLMKGSNQPRTLKPCCKTAYDITSRVLAKAVIFHPVIVFDHHEDKIDPNHGAIDAKGTYSYINGKDKDLKLITGEITNIFKENGFPILDTGITRFGEKIVNGFVFNQPDGSIDELLITSRYFDFDEKVIKHKKGAKATIVIETTNNPDGSIPLRKRINVHRQIIRQYPHFWDFLNT